MDVKESAKINIYQEDVLFHPLNHVYHGDFLFQQGTHNVAPLQKETWLWSTFILCLLD